METWLLTQPVDVKSMACFDDQLVLLTVNGDIVKVNDSTSSSPATQKIASFRRYMRVE